MQRPIITIIILNYNSSQDTEKCLSYLKKQTYPKLNVIIVDNASTKDGELHSIARVASAYNATLLKNGRNIGFSAGNNVGIRHGMSLGTEWFLILNPDVELRDPDFITEMIKRANNYPDVAVVGPNVLLPSGERQNPMRELTFFEELLWPLETIKRKLGLFKGYLGEDTTGYCEKVSGCCFLINSSFLRENGLLDEGVFLYCEEPILAKQVNNKGKKILYIKEITAFHQHFDSQKGSNRNRMEQFTKSRIYYLKKYSNYSKLKLKALLVSKKMLMMVWKNKAY